MIQSRLTRTLTDRRSAGRPRPPNAAERFYVGALRGYADDFEQTVRHYLRQDEILSAVVRNDGFFSRVREVLGLSFAYLSRKLQELPVDRAGQETDRHVKTEAERLIRIPRDTLVTSGTVGQWRRNNVELITKMTREQLDRVAEVLEQFDGQDPFTIAKQLTREFKITQKRAELIARDQILKLNGNLTEVAHRRAGITRYRWSTSRDSSVRAGHKALEGQIFAYADPPVVSPRGDRANPGQDYECRCVAIPVLDELG